MKRGYKEFKITQIGYNNGKPKTDIVEGKPVVVAGFEEFDFFVRKEDQWWVLSEVTTGCVVARCHTIKGFSNLLKDQGRTPEMVRKAIKNYFVNN